MNETSIDVKLSARGYEIVIGDDVLGTAGHRIGDWLDARQLTSRRCIVVTDQNLAELHARTVVAAMKRAGFKVWEFVMAPGEPSKCHETVHAIYDVLVDNHAGRRTVVIAVGGGVVGDSAGFAAATYGRGVPFVQVPTSLLAHVDSSVGGKVGINHPRGKNLIGAFHQPVGVLCDTTTLGTLPPRDYVSGLAEVVKYGVILDAEFFSWLEQNVDAINEQQPEALTHVIARSCQLKADVVERDEFERIGLRAVLNYGHTFAHAFEALTQYGTLMHGEAVSIGMHYASRLAEHQGLIDSDATRRQVELMERLGLPVRLDSPESMLVADIIDCMKRDKKAVAGSLRFVLPTKIGHVTTFDDVTEQAASELLTEFGHG